MKNKYSVIKLVYFTVMNNTNLNIINLTDNQTDYFSEVRMLLV
jgi:hypothetical protein